MQQENYCARDPLLGSSGPLSLNVFYQHKKASLCKSNCRNIEVSVLYPSHSTSMLEDLPAAAMQDAKDVDLSPVEQETYDFNDYDLTPPSSSKPFPFQQLPLEIRLKIYAYLLPPRTHTIVTQYPHNGYFYNTSTTPQYSTQSFYPSSPDNALKLTTYKVLNTNFRPDYPEPGIYPSIFRVCRQLRDEAEPVLYGTYDTVFDFGVHLEALTAFFNDRSPLARQTVRNVRIAREVPCVENKNGLESKSVDIPWINLCAYLHAQLLNLQNVDLTIWSSSGSTASFPVPVDSLLLDVDVDLVVEEMRTVQQWREWEWTGKLLGLEPLRKATVTWWGFTGTGATPFDSWLARRMVGDKLVRDRMVMEGVVTEGLAVLPGGWDAQKPV